LEKQEHAVGNHWEACIDPTATIGKGCKIWNDVQIREQARVGDGSIIGKGVYVDAAVTIGSYCKIQNYACIYSGVTLEDCVFIGPSVTFTNDLYPRSFNNDWRMLKTVVHKGASIGANATIICGVIIGEYSMIGAGSVVTKDVQPFSLVIGNPARVIDYVNMDGTRRYIEVMDIAKEA